MTETTVRRVPVSDQDIADIVDALAYTYPMYGWKPMCKRRIDRGDTLPVDQGRPCTDCLVAAIRAEAGR